MVRQAMHRTQITCTVFLVGILYILDTLNLIKSTLQTWSNLKLKLPLQQVSSKFCFDFYKVPLWNTKICTFLRFINLILKFQNAYKETLNVKAIFDQIKGQFQQFQSVLFGQFKFRQILAKISGCKIQVYGFSVRFLKKFRSLQTMMFQGLI